MVFNTILASKCVFQMLYLWNSWYKKYSERLLSKGQGWILLTVFIYFINRGTYDIYVKCDGVGRCVGTYDNRGCFGELALMYNTPRAATIIATSPGSIWGLVSRVLLLSYF